MARKRSERFVVTGPGLGGEIPEPSYTSFGPALSRALTAAEAAKEEGTWYVRDGVTDKILGHSVRTEKVVFCSAFVSSRGETL